MEAQAFLKSVDPMRRKRRTTTRRRPRTRR